MKRSNEQRLHPDISSAGVRYGYSDKLRVRKLKIPSKPVSYVPDETATLTAQNEFWKATAQWKRKAGIWTCINADEIIGWMRKLSPEKAKFELAKRGCTWEWL